MREQDSKVQSEVGWGSTLWRSTRSGGVPIPGSEEHGPYYGPVIPEIGEVNPRIFYICNKVENYSFYDNVHFSRKQFLWKIIVFVQINEKLYFIIIYTLVTLREIFKVIQTRTQNKNVTVQ